MSFNILKHVSSRSPSRDRGRDTERRSRDPSPDSRRASFSSLLSPRARSQSPFSVGPLHTDYDDIPIQLGRHSSSSSVLSADSDDIERSDSDDDGFSSDGFGEQTNENTELNAMSPAIEQDEDPLEHADPLGEGINVVFQAPEPHFATSHHRGHITVTQGDPVQSLTESGRKHKTYLVCSDMSAESKFAMDWAIGMVLRDGDVLVVATVMETDSKIDPTEGQTDHIAKLHNQQERESHAFAISRQVVSMLQRTKLQVTVVCQGWHAKNMRHHILDLVDLVEPAFLIVGSRGIGGMKGIVLGSTSHYLVQKSSAPVMVARRRLKRPARHAAHLQQRARVPLSQAAVEKEATHIEKPVDLAEEVEEASPTPVSGEESEAAPRPASAEPEPERGRQPARR